MIKVLARFDKGRDDQILNFDEVMSTETKTEMIKILSNAFDIPILKNQIGKNRKFSNLGEKFKGSLKADTRHGSKR